ncbi:MAG: primosomal replication protein N [Pseudomonadota bacterium]
MLSGRITALDALRHTPAGVPLLGFRIGHESRQVEAGVERDVHCEVAAMALAENAVKAARFKVGDAVRLEGFLARKSRNSTQLVLHANLIELLNERG